MLHREDIIKILKEMNLPKDQYWITSGAGLVIHGVKDSTGDIDLGCTTELFNQLLKKGYKYKVADDNTRIMEINDSIEILENWFVDEIELIEDLPVGSLDSIKKQKAELGREKDFRDIKLIDEYLKERIILEKVAGVCGCICSDCRIFEKDCMGCHAIKGMACWLHEVGLDICDFYECCAIDRGLKHCGECTDIPCEKFIKNKNPSWTKEQHKKIIEERVILLKNLCKKKD